MLAIIFVLSVICMGWPLGNQRDAHKAGELSCA